jgi:hypothetical protein
VATLAGLLVVAGSVAWGLAGARVARAAHGGTVALEVDGKVLSSTLTVAESLARARAYTSFRVVAPRHVPRGVTLQDVNVTTFGGSYAFSTVSLDYAGPGSRAFSLRESKLHVSTSVGGGTVTRVRVGSVSGTLVETKKGARRALDLSWYTSIGYDLITLGTTTRLTPADLLAIARSL